MAKKRFSTSSEREDKIRRRNSIIVGLILIGLMGFSVLSYSFYGNDSTNTDIKYNGYTLKSESVNGVTVLTTTVDKTKFFFYSAPTIANKFKNIEFETAYSFAPTIVFTKDPLSLNETSYSDEQYYNYLYNDVNVYSGKKVILAVTKEDLLNDFPIITCADASPTRIVVVLNNSVSSLNSNLATVDSNCFRADASYLDILSFRDYVLYNNLGVKNG
ncbi:hypothetical protein COV13_01595 [Candidatus Woesearchaeota archaeon CG10_big_fil_rev_8_21_14_0_10_32_9]|nr:MAG: hypothetical protein COV13_01595 [Candidatus Woesearchaeota archaeon CG10_big_fil_rev_8_21_14_0_10_32_9]